MKHIVLTCDDCFRGNDDDITVKSFRVNRGSEMDPSGNAYITNWDYVDYCSECYVRVLKKYGDDIKPA